MSHLKKCKHCKKAKEQEEFRKTYTGSVSNICLECWDSRKELRIKNGEINSEKKKPKHMFKTTPEVRDFLKKFNFKRPGFIQVRKVKKSLETVLACFQDYYDLDLMERLKIKEI